MISTPCSPVSRHPLTLSLIVALSGVNIAFAQQSHGQDAQTLDTIVVTSQGRTEELQKAAAPIAVFSDIQIQNSGITNTADFVRLVPNMSYDTSFTIGNSFIVMRGIQNFNNGDAPITIVVDGIPQNNQKEFKMDLFDIEQIEVLRGPQGGLYGRNSVAGAVVINTKQPSNYAEGFAQFGIGNHGARKFTGSASGPVVDDRLFYRFSVSANEFDGEVTNTYVNEKNDFSKNHDLRGQLKWQPNENNLVEWRISRSKLRGGSNFDASFDPGDPENAKRWRYPFSNLLGHSNRQIDSTSLKYRWDGSALSVTSITGYVDIDENYYGDLDFCNPVDCPTGMFGSGSQADQAQVLNVQQVSQEIRLTSAEGAHIQWTAGAYLLETRRKLSTIAHFVDFDPPPFIINNNESNRNRAWAVFGQVLIPFGDWDRLEMSLRLDQDRRHQTDLTTSNDRKKNFHAWQPKITWSHDFSDTQMMYATAGRGFRSGGFNGIGGVEFKPEVLTSYEIGYKSSWLDNRLTFNTALFYEDDKDYQFFYISLDEGGAQVISNLKRVGILGLETELNWRVRAGFEVFANLGLMDSEIRETGPLGTTLPITKGRRAPRTEPYSAVIGSQWNFPLGAYRGMFRFDVSRVGERVWEADNLYRRNPVTLANTRMTFFSNSQWNLTAWATNLFNRHYYGHFESNAFGGLGRDIATHAPGRRFGVDFRYDF